MRLVGRLAQHSHGCVCCSFVVIQISVLRLLKQLSEVYSSMKISALEALVPFMPFSEVEAVLVDAVKCDYLQVCVINAVHDNLAAL